MYYVHFILLPTLPAVMLLIDNQLMENTAIELESFCGLPKVGVAIDTRHFYYYGA